MTVYRAPLEDFRFVLHDLLSLEQQLVCFDPGTEITEDLIDSVLEMAGKLAEEILHPGSQAADLESCQLVGDQVITPDGYKAAYQAVVDGGWIGISAEPEHGGQGLPEIVWRAASEMFQTADISFADYIGLTTGAYGTIRAHAPAKLQERYLEKLASGQWFGTMCMTEPHCGTDLGLIKTRAIPDTGDNYSISGTKIFISGGDQDLTENIVHLVLAKLPDAPEGSRGISLFLVPKILPDGSRNGVRAVGLEHKMGYHGSSTCEMLFENARGWLIGEPHFGLACLFTMINHSRIEVGLQGYCQSVKAYQSAVEYAKERLQSRSLSRPKHDRSGADPIIVHPDIRKKLMKTRAFVEAARALCMWATLELDRSHKHSDAGVRQEAADLVELMTPVIKAVFSDFGFETCNDCMDVLGGHGFVRDNGMEQLVRDVRLSQIQEGTNHIQALDLIGRKLSMHDGRSYQHFVNRIENTLLELNQDAELSDLAESLAQVLAELNKATKLVLSRSALDREEQGVAGFEYMRVFGYVAMAWVWARMVLVAKEKLADPARRLSPDFYRNKLLTARFYYRHMLPMTQGCLAVLQSDKSAVMALDADQF